MILGSLKIKTLSGRTRGRQYSPTTRIWKMASSANTQSAMRLSPLSILKKICAPSESARPDPEATDAGSTDSRAVTDQLTDVETVIDLVTSTEVAASPNTRSRSVVHSSTRRQASVHFDLEASGPLGTQELMPVV